MEAGAQRVVGYQSSQGGPHVYGNYFKKGWAAYFILGKNEAPEFISNTIMEGYKLPIAYVLKSNNKSAKLYEQLVNDAIQKLLDGD